VASAGLAPAAAARRGRSVRPLMRAHSSGDVTASFRTGGSLATRARPRKKSRTSSFVIDVARNPARRSAHSSSSRSSPSATPAVEVKSSANHPSFPVTTDAADASSPPPAAPAATAPPASSADMLGCQAGCPRSIALPTRATHPRTADTHGRQRADSLGTPTAGSLGTPTAGGLDTRRRRSVPSAEPRARRGVEYAQPKSPSAPRHRPQP